MNIVDIIIKKKNNFPLTKEEIYYAVNGYTNGLIPDYQMSSLLMAIVLNGMNESEIINLTQAMIDSGEVIDLNNIDGIKIDKHSTGGVGDKTTLIYGPVVAACGVKVAKMSGRGLGHTGGTIDKLESIKDFNVEILKENFVRQVNDINVAIVSQMGNLVPADKKIYALRDVTGTVESIPLIAASVMSKKIASGADKIIIDVKVGSGALIKDIESARKLAHTMIKIGKHFNKDTVCFITNMNEPLGCAVGNALEVIESINILKGSKQPSDLYNLIVELSSYSVMLAKNISLEDARKQVIAVLENGEAYNKFVELVNMQGGNIDKIEVSDDVVSVKSNKEGYINKIDALKIGNIVKMLGAGRYKKDDIIDYKVGVVLSKKVGDYVKVGDELLRLYLGEKEIDINEVYDCFEIDKILNNSNQLIYEIIK